jgi:lysophospholipase L1-like esterase
LPKILQIAASDDLFYMKTTSLLLLLACLALLTNCGQATIDESAQLFLPDQEDIRYSGRVDMSNLQAPVLMGSASFVELSFSGDSCQVLLQKLNPPGEHNYVSIELDGDDLGRIRLEADTMSLYTLRATSPGAETHSLKIFKATEAQNGNIAFGGVKSVDLQPLAPPSPRKIEFIGNSITCGMGIAWKEIPCDSGVWYDQHHAYWAYGPRVSRALDADFMLSSVSGIGMYRNWNSLSPTMPDVYENMYLDTDESQAWDFSRFRPDLVSIALGTNDFSLGDGVKERLPFDSAQYVSSYIGFVNTVYSKYPDSQLCLLTSPMVTGEKGVLFANCLRAVQQHFRQERPEKKKIAIYDFNAIDPHGCGDHPDKEDHAQMAEALLPFYKELMGW